jgi:hypothetical protein
MAYRKSSKIIIQSKNYRDSFAAPLTFVGFSIINDSLLTLNCNNNVLLYNVFKKKIIDTFFIGKTTNICFKDSEVIIGLQQLVMEFIG